MPQKSFLKKEFLVNPMVSISLSMRNPGIQEKICRIYITGFVGLRKDFLWYIGLLNYNYNSVIIPRISWRGWRRGWCGSLYSTNTIGNFHEIVLYFIIGMIYTLNSFKTVLAFALNHQIHIIINKIRCGFHRYI